ncbi:hypothetical protein DSO57_1034717 [Entomophthora muscae]|uniref:Uncharacterized protein n=1 Tax=Entomophthora muscae TaxID=34485 RepID=A0ACC2REJ1_9FUNG|nr:hypothetical protein DSO57_1034717 [Entomophthora muscae]
MLMGKHQLQDLNPETLRAASLQDWLPSHLQFPGLKPERDLNLGNLLRLSIFPHCTKKLAQKPAKPLNSLEDLAHTIDERFVLTYPSQVANNDVLNSVPTWEEYLIN